MTIFGENEDEKVDKKITNYDSPEHYDDLFQLLKHLNK